jgi:hypothetical protein
MADHIEPPNMAVMQYQIQAQQAAIDRLMPIVEGLVITTNNLVVSCKYAKEIQDKMEPRVQKLWDAKNKAGGVGMLLGWLGGFALGIVAVGGFVLALIEHYGK